MKKKRYKNERKDPEYEKFRKAVLDRDGHKCQMPNCGYKKRRWLQVHHIIPYSKSVALRTCPENGITLCFGCHKKIHGKESYYGKIFLMIIQGKDKNGRK